MTQRGKNGEENKTEYPSAIRQYQTKVEIPTIGISGKGGRE